MKIDISKNYSYRNGEPARILCVDAPDDRTPVRAMCPNGYVTFNKLDGSVGDHGNPDYDLIEIPEAREPREWELVGNKIEGKPIAPWEKIRVREVLPTSEGIPTDPEPPREESLTLEVGKWYENRRGEKVGPLEINDGVFRKTNPFKGSQWTYRPDGGYLDHTSAGEHARDLIRCVPAPSEFPEVGARYFVHADKFESDAIYIRHDDEKSPAAVVTAKGEQGPNSEFGWYLGNTLSMVERGKAMEVSKEYAESLVATVTEPPKSPEQEWTDDFVAAALEPPIPEGFPPVPETPGFRQVVRGFGWKGGDIASYYLHSRGRVWSYQKTPRFPDGELDQFYIELVPMDEPTGVVEPAPQEGLSDTDARQADDGKPPAPSCPAHVEHPGSEWIYAGEGPLKVDVFGRTESISVWEGGVWSDNPSRGLDIGSHYRIKRGSHEHRIQPWFRESQLSDEPQPEWRELGPDEVIQEGDELRNDLREWVRVVRTSYGMKASEFEFRVRRITPEPQVFTAMDMAQGEESRQTASYPPPESEWPEKPDPGQGMVWERVFEESGYESVIGLLDDEGTGRLKWFKISGWMEGTLVFKAVPAPKDPATEAFRLQSVKDVIDPAESAAKAALEPRHLRYLMYEAPNEHPQKVMESLGVTYVKSTPQSMGDQWWFWSCKNIPSPLPNFLEDLSINPHDAVGFGLSKEDADMLTIRAGTDLAAKNGLGEKPIQRWYHTPGVMCQSSEGMWVRYSDHLATIQDAQKRIDELEDVLRGIINLTSPNHVGSTRAAVREAAISALSGKQ